VAVAGPVAWWLTAASTKPRVSVDREMHSWGRVHPGEEVRTTFEIRNQGGAALTFGKPTTSCGCAEPDLQTSEVPPGGRTTLGVGFHVPIEPGRVVHFVDVPTNDSRRPSIRFTLFAEARPGLRAVPQSIHLGRLEREEDFHATIQIRSPEGEPFRIGHAEGDLTGLSVVQRTAGALPLHHLEVTYQAGARLGHLRGAVRVTTDLAETPYLDIPVGGEIVGLATVNPALLQIDREQVNERVRHVLLVRGTPGTPDVTIRDVAVSPPWQIIEHAVRPYGRGQVAVELAVLFPEGQPARPGEVLLTLGSPEEATYTVPLTVRGWLAPLPE
jgi:hypothetical protein